MRGESLFGDLVAWVELKAIYGLLYLASWIDAGWRHLTGKANGKWGGDYQ